MEADGSAARIERGERSGGTADRLRTALKRRVRLLAAAQIQDQERRLLALGLVRGGDVPTGLECGTLELDCQL